MRVEIREANRLKELEISSEVSADRLVTRTRAGLALAAGLLVAACAAEGPAVMDLDPGIPAGADAPLWPAPPEVPRYAYAGELTGEANFSRVDSAQRGSAARAFAWLVGLELGVDDRRPVVLQRPQSGVTDERGRVYVTDVSRRAVYVFDEQAGTLQIWDRADDARNFEAPIGVALDGEGGVLVTDAELGAVFRLDRDGQPLGSFGGDVLERPTGLARDPLSGRIYVADTRRNDIKIFDHAGLLVDFIGRRGKASGELNAPTHIAFRRGRLYVTDALNSRVQVFDGDGRVLEIFGERGLYIGNLTRPKGIAVDDEGNIYVVESYYDHLLVYDREGRFLLPIGGAGQAPGQFFLPAGVWTDSRNRVYVADMFNGRVAIFQFLGGS